MGNKLFKTIIERKIDIFANTFGGDSNSLFKSDSKLIHPLEYGMYREKCFKELLEFIVEKAVAVSDGFIITAFEDISTQCDIVVYQSDVIPLIDNSIAKFFPIEIVTGIGESKSNLNKTQLKDTLRKLAKNKMLTSKRSGTVRKSNGTFGEYDYLTTFLICNKLSFDISTLDFEEIYQDIPRVYWHNAILSLEDGLIAYNLSFKDFPPKMKNTFVQIGGNINVIRIWEYPVHIEHNEEYHSQIKVINANKENKYLHVIHFLTIIKSALDYEKKYNFDFVKYLDLDGSIFL